ncbi:hypothetical protein RIF29_23140 [Crotalaria pallida]|uniref:SKP1 component POZ domain-containing protein n=1 Tax=Crotalaria pallida TaxID=3830 RepID=A0AAN9F5A8_CROPI
MASSSSVKNITLKTLQGDLFQVDEEFVNECMKIKPLIDKKFTNNVNNVTISLKIKSETLSKVIQYANKHAEYGVIVSKTDEENLKAWDAEFMKVDMGSLYDLITVSIVPAFCVSLNCETKLHLAIWIGCANESCQAASDLGHENLLDLICQTVAEKYK